MTFGAFRLKMRATRVHN